MAEKDPKSPETTSIAYDEMSPTWNKVATLLGGTKAMRSAGRAYLHQHAMEKDEDYLERLDRAVLLNLTSLTLNAWVGRPFSKPITYEDVPPVIDELLWDVDMAGSDVQVFCREWFYDGMAKALSHVLVDYPRTDAGDGKQRTLADDQGLRPYWVHLKPEQVIFASAEVVNGREILREIRIKEETSEQIGFAEIPVVKIRRILRDESGVHVEIYRQEKKDWRLDESYEMTIPEIPLATFYSNRSGFMTGKSPLEDLADLNIAHWQSGADQTHILTVARFPILAASGVTDEDGKLVVGPNNWLLSKNPQGKFYYVEHTGAAIGAGKEDLAGLEERMAMYGADFLKKKPQTLGERLLDNAEVTSPLQDATVRFGLALKHVLDLTAMWLNMEDGGIPTMHTDFQPVELNDSELQALKAMRQGPADISREAFLKEMIRRGVLDEEYDIEEDQKLLEEEQMDFAPRMISPFEEETVEEETEEETAEEPEGEGEEETQ